MRTSSCVGILLAGGLARRMGGGDKVLRMAGGIPLLAHAVAALRPQCEGLVLSANDDPARFAGFALPIVADDLPGFKGPLAGILAGLDWIAAPKPRRVVAKVEWHPGVYPRVGFIVTNMARPAENVVAFYNKRGTCEQWIKEGKGAIKWTRLSCRSFAANAVRLQLHALAYNLGNFLRTLATPEPIKDWSLTSLKEKLIKIGAKIVSHGRYVAFQMTEVAIPRNLFAEILRLIAELRLPPVTSTA
jgi:Transposase DDE domain group 1/MobA-like NTP transferase domain